MTQYYEPEFKKKIVRLHLEEGRSLKGLASEYGVSKASISNWTKQFREECQTNEKAQTDYDFMKENLKLKNRKTAYHRNKAMIKASIRDIYHSHGCIPCRYIFAVRELI